MTTEAIADILARALAQAASEAREAATSAHRIGAPNAFALTRRSVKAEEAAAKAAKAAPRTATVEHVHEGIDPAGGIVATATVRYSGGTRTNIRFAVAITGEHVVVGDLRTTQMFAWVGKTGTSSFNANPTRWIRAFYGGAGE